MAFEPERSTGAVTRLEDSTERASTDETTEEEVIRDSYSIVLYSFRNEETAISTAQELIKYGFGVYTCSRIIDNSTFFRVSIGSFSDIKSAILVSWGLEEPYNAQNFISSINSSCEIISQPE